MSAGAAHSAAITCDNQVYTWGAGEQGRLGHNSQDVEFEPRAVRQFELDAVEMTQVFSSPLLLVALLWLSFTD